MNSTGGENCILRDNINYNGMLEFRVRIWRHRVEKREKKRLSIDGFWKLTLYVANYTSCRELTFFATDNTLLCGWRLYFSEDIIKNVEPRKYFLKDGFFVTDSKWLNHDNNPDRTEVIFFIDWQF